MASEIQQVPALAPKKPARSGVSSEMAIPNIMKQGRFTPWLYLLPALIVMTTFIVYPGLNTLYLSFRNVDGSDWASSACIAGQPCWGIFESFRYALTSPIMQTAFVNNLKWILFMVSGAVLIGLLIAVLADRVRYEALAKSVIFLPMAISFVGAGVIWRFVYAYDTGPTQIGLLNSLVTTLGGQPVSWLTEPQTNTIALVIVGVWMWTGFCMTILAAAIKGVPAEINEAARMDGANEIQLFQHVTVPSILPTLTVVVTTMTINVLKVFDIVYVMTGGNYGTEVIANRMYSEQYQAFNTGRAAAIAVVLVAVIIPMMILNIRRFRAEEAIR
ncbi:MAG: carbohydrate ABC transporter permease [Anaerolineae bacterium]